MCKEYNGWTNYETWNFHLHFENLCSEVCALEMPDIEKIEHLKGYAQDYIDELGLEVGFAQDIVLAGLRMVDFWDILRTYEND